MGKNRVHSNKVIENLREERQLLDANCSKQDMENDMITVCSRADGSYCGVYAFPSAKWRNGDCPMADEFLRTKVEVEEPKGKVRVGQQKQKKRK